jgi:hypothetical protein
MKITHCRLTSIWVEAFPELLRMQGKCALAGLLDPPKYATLFNDVLETDADPLVTLPWPRAPGSKYPARNNYWNDVIIAALRDNARSNSGMLAFRSVIPFKHKEALAKLGTPDRSFVEGWYYPDGIALTVTFWLSGPFDVNGLPKTVSRLLHDPLPITWSDGNQEQLALVGLAEKCLDKLREQGFDGVAPGFRPNPSRVFTITQGQYDSTDHAAEEAVMRQLVLGMLGAPDPNLAPQRHIYGFSQNAVIWRPDRFASTMPNLHTLGCLHRNVVAAGIHVASLLRAAAVLVAEVVDPQIPIPPLLDNYTRAVAGSLGRMYGGVDTYKLPWIRSQIDEPTASSMVNRLRARVDQGPLK